jgi:predicted nucleic-acid-binding protein
MTLESLDTNILLRLVLNDVPEQGLKAQALLNEKARRFYVADLALTELVFVLEKLYRLSRAEIAELLDIILGIPQLILDRPLFRATVQLYLAHPALSIMDCCLVSAAAAHDAIPLWTFDKKLAHQCPNARELR